jgi:ketosteroid isomerase-like protein
MRDLTYPSYFSQLGRLPTSAYIREGAVKTNDLTRKVAGKKRDRTTDLPELPEIQAQQDASTERAPQAQSVEQTMKRLRRAVGRADEVIATATTVFPFTLFPDKITIDREKITIAHRFFFRVSETISLRIEDVLHVAADVGPFFGSLRLTSRFFDNNAQQQPYRVNYLWREDAQRLKRILQGYLIARKNNIDCAKLSTKQLRESLDKLGQSPETEE